MAGSWSIVVIMVSILEKERDSYFRYSLRNSLKSVTRKEPGCRWNNNPRSRIYWIRSKLELFIGGNSDLRKCDCVRRLISVPRIFVRCAWAWHYFLNCSWLSEHRSQQATRGWVVIYIFIYYSYFSSKAYIFACLAFGGSLFWARLSKAANLWEIFPQVFLGH